MANHISHAALPFPVKKARFTIYVPYLDSSGTPTDPTTPDTEISKDAGAFADCAEEVSTISGSNGTGYMTLTGAEMDCSLAAIAAKVASGPKPTLEEIRPRVLPVVLTGTAQAGANGTITLASVSPAVSDCLIGCIIRTTGGTGGGGTGGANNQARVITAYSGATKVATVEPNWETNPDNTTTYDILITEMAHLSTLIYGGIRRNMPFSGFSFLMTDSTNHNPATGKTVTATRSIDGAAFGSGTLGAVTEVANGYYKLDIPAADLDGREIVLRFTASGCDDRFVEVFTGP